MVNASHLLKKADSDEEFAQAKKASFSIRDELENGADFTDLVKRESDDSVNEGKLGSFGKGRMVPEFEKVAFH